VRFDIGEIETGAQGAHPAGDIETDPAGRDDTAADREAVAPVGVGHRIRRRDDSRQAGDVGHLLGDLVVHRFQQFARREDHPRHPHAAGGRQFPFKVSAAFQS